eukprot:PhM_4_TR12833/c0_g1_i1/m.5149
MSGFSSGSKTSPRRPTLDLEQSTGTAFLYSLSKVLTTLKKQVASGETTVTFTPSTLTFAAARVRAHSRRGHDLHDALDPELTPRSEQRLLKTITEGLKSTRSILVMGREGQEGSHPETIDLTAFSDKLTTVEFRDLEICTIKGGASVKCLHLLRTTIQPPHKLDGTAVGHTWDAFPRLEELVLVSCRAHLANLPRHLNYTSQLSTVRKLVLHDCSNAPAAGCVTTTTLDLVCTSAVNSDACDEATSMTPVPWRSLKCLRVSDMNLNGVHPSWSLLSGLVDLSVSGNDLFDFSELKDTVSLRRVNLAWNTAIGARPNEWAPDMYFPYITSLDLSNCALYVIPPAVRVLIDLQHLAVNSNCLSQWTEIEDVVSACPSLTSLLINGNFDLIPVGITPEARAEAYVTKLAVHIFSRNRRRGSDVFVNKELFKTGVDIHASRYDQILEAHAKEHVDPKTPPPISPFLTPQRCPTTVVAAEVVPPLSLEVATESATIHDGAVGITEDGAVPPGQTFAPGASNLENAKNEYGDDWLTVMRQDAPASPRPLSSSGAVDTVATTTAEGTPQAQPKVKSRRVTVVKKRLVRRSSPGRALQDTSVLDDSSKDGTVDTEDVTAGLDRASRETPTSSAAATPSVGPAQPPVPVPPLGESMNGQDTPPPESEDVHGHTSGLTDEEFGRHTSPVLVNLLHTLFERVASPGHHNFVARFISEEERNDWALPRAGPGRTESVLVRLDPLHGEDTRPASLHASFAIGATSMLWIEARTVPATGAVYMSLVEHASKRRLFTLSLRPPKRQDKPVAVAQPSTTHHVRFSNAVFNGVCDVVKNDMSGTCILQDADRGIVERNIGAVCNLTVLCCVLVVPKMDQDDLVKKLVQGMIGTKGFRYYRDWWGPVDAPASPPESDIGENNNNTVDHMHDDSTLSADETVVELADFRQQFPFEVLAKEEVEAEGAMPNNRPIDTIDECQVHFKGSVVQAKERGNNAIATTCTVFGIALPPPVPNSPATVPGHAVPNEQLLWMLSASVTLDVASGEFTCTIAGTTTHVYICLDFNDEAFERHVRKLYFLPVRCFLCKTLRSIKLDAQLDTVVLGFIGSAAITVHTRDPRLTRRLLHHLYTMIRADANTNARLVLANPHVDFGLEGYGEVMAVRCFGVVGATGSWGTRNSSAVTTNQHIDPLRHHMTNHAFSALRLSVGPEGFAVQYETPDGLLEDPSSSLSAKSKRPLSVVMYRWGGVKSVWRHRSYIAITAHAVLESNCVEKDAERASIVVLLFASELRSGDFVTSVKGVWSQLGIDVPVSHMPEREFLTRTLFTIPIDGNSGAARKARGVDMALQPLLGMYRRAISQLQE